MKKRLFIYCWFHHLQSQTKFHFMIYKTRLHDTEYVVVFNNQITFLAILNLYSITRYLKI